MATDWPGRPEWVDHHPDPRLTRAERRAWRARERAYWRDERAAWTGVDAVRRPPFGIRLWIGLASAVMTGAALLAAYAVAQVDFVAAFVLLVATVAAAGICLLGIDYAQQWDVDRDEQRERSMTKTPDRAGLIEDASDGVREAGNKLGDAIRALVALENRDEHNAITARCATDLSTMVDQLNGVWGRLEGQR